MRDLYKDDSERVEQKIRLKDLEKMTKEEIREAYAGICAAARAYIHQITEKFLTNIGVKDRFQMAAKTGIINTLPPQYNEAFIKRVDRLCKMAESLGYDVRFAKWKTTKEYGWFFVREDG